MKITKALMGKSAEKWAMFLWTEFASRLSKTKSAKELKLMLEKLLSEDEKKMIARRLATIGLLKSGKSYKEISEILWLSPNTVSSIKKNVIANHVHYKSYRDFYGGPKKWSSSSEGMRIKKSFWDELFGNIDFWEILKNPPRPVGMGLLRHRDMFKKR